MNDVIARTLSALADAPADTSVRDWKREINSALFRADLPTLGKDQTIGHLRVLVGRHPEPLPARFRTPEPVAHTPVREAEHFCHSLFVGRDDNARCTSRVSDAGERCGKHAKYPTDAHVIARRAEVEAQRAEYLARKEAREMLAELAA